MNIAKIVDEIDQLELADLKKLESWLFWLNLELEHPGFIDAIHKLHELCGPDTDAMLDALTEEVESARATGRKVNVAAAVERVFGPISPRVIAAANILLDWLLSEAKRHG